MDRDMSEMEFKDIVKDVSAFFGTPKERQLEILFEIFRAYPYEQMKAACRFLIEHHDSRYFPTPRDIHEALRECAELKVEVPRMPDEEEEYPRCHDCEGRGWSCEDRNHNGYCYSVAVYCACEKGRRMKAAHEAFLKRRYHERQLEGA